jgi:hypothetical protein
MVSKTLRIRAVGSGGRRRRPDTLLRTRKIAIVSAGYALLFTDLVDSTALIARLGDAAAGALFRHTTPKRVTCCRPAAAARSTPPTASFCCSTVGDGGALRPCYQVGAAALGLAARVACTSDRWRCATTTRLAVARGAKPIEVEGLTKALRGTRNGRPPVAARRCCRRRRARPGSLPRRVVIESHGHWRLKGNRRPAELIEIASADSAFEPPTDSAKPIASSPTTGSGGRGAKCRIGCRRSAMLSSAGRTSCCSWRAGSMVDSVS